MGHSPQLIDQLKEIARQIREKSIRMISHVNSGHPGPSLSSADILAVLYFHILRTDPSNPHWNDRDRFILSKGHGCPSFYAALAMRGYFPVETLYSLRQVGSILQGHPDMKKTPGVDFTTGSLGHGLAAGVGMALMGKLDSRSYRVFVLLGDGECQEGSVWEAAEAAGHYHLDNLIGIVDRNGLQNDGPTEQIMTLEPLNIRFESFGWNVINVNGHDIEQLLTAFEEAKQVKRKPTMIIAHTIKGRGVSFMEGNNKFHDGCPTKEEAEQALRELGEARV